MTPEDRTREHWKPSALARRLLGTRAVLQSLVKDGFREFACVIVSYLYLRSVEVDHD